EVPEVLAFERLSNILAELNDRIHGFLPSVDWPRLERQKIRREQVSGLVSSPRRERRRSHLPRGLEVGLACYQRVEIFPFCSAGRLLLESPSAEGFRGVAACAAAASPHDERQRQATGAVGQRPSSRRPLRYRRRHKVQGSRPKEPPMATDTRIINGVDFIIVSTEDFDTARDFYANVLGL